MPCVACTHTRRRLLPLPAVLRLHCLDGARQLAEHGQHRDDNYDPQKVVVAHGLQPANQADRARVVASGDRGGGRQQRSAA